jgi:hypothetical protein
VNVMSARLWKAETTALKSKSFRVNGFKLDQITSIKCLKCITIENGFAPNWTIFSSKAFEAIIVF